MRLSHAVFSVLLACSVSLASARAEQVPLPVKLDLRVEESGARQAMFSALTPQQQKLAYHLYRAARAGRTLLFVQSHRHSLALKAALESSLAPRNVAYTTRLLGGATTDALKEWKAYAAMFEEYGGPYSPANRKFALTRVTSDQARALLSVHAKGATRAARDEMLRLLVDPRFEVIKTPEDPEGADLAQAGGNLYARGITGPELKAAIDAGLRVELNCLVTRDRTGKIACQKLTTRTPGVVGRALTEVVAQLREARPFASTACQGQEIDHLVRYFERGDVEEFRQASIAWVRDGSESVVDFTLGFIEVYDDFKGSMGSWESYVQILDPTTTRISRAVAGNAQHFEDLMPYGQFKKRFPDNYSPPALMVFYFQEIAGMRSGGYNLPNFDDIRRDVGFKNIIRLDLPGLENDPHNAAVTEEAIRAFIVGSRVAQVVADQAKAWRTLVLLHEIIGHGSGTYDTAKYRDGEDPISALGNLGSSLEEQRADLAALVFAADPALIAAGVYADAPEATRVRDSLYDYYLARFMMAAAKSRSFAEPHARGNWLLVKQLLDAGVVEWADPSGTGAPQVATQVLRVRDYEAFHALATRLLGDLQRIKANREETELRSLWATDAPLDAISAPWAQAAIARGAALKFTTPKLQQPWALTRDSAASTIAVKLCGTADLDGLVGCLREY